MMVHFHASHGKSPRMTPSRASLESILRHCGFSLTSPQFDALWAYHRMLREANASLNLTRIHQFENMVLKHYVDSLLVLKFEELPTPLIDMGSGPGLPGIPLKIARPEVAMILAEPRANRAEFLQDVCNRLHLENVEVVARKVGSKFARKARGIITRAVASIPETLDRVASCLDAGGKMLFMKGPDCDGEIGDAARSHASSFRLVADHAYTIPDTSHERRLVVYERLDSPAPLVVTASSAYSGAIREVTSDANPTFKVTRDLLTGRGIRKHGQALLAGSRIVAEVLEKSPQNVLAWVTELDGPAPPEASSQPIWMRVAPALFAELDTAGTHAPMLLVRVPDMPAWSDEAEWPAGCTLFLPFQDPENIGGVIRSAAAFGVSRVVLLKEAAHPFHPKSARAAGPALFAVPFLQGPSIHDLTAKEIPLFALSADGEVLANKTFPERFGLVAGMEGPGLPPHLRAGERLQIPIAPGVESLNAATATAIALYEWSRKGLISSPPAPGGAIPPG